MVASDEPQSPHVKTTVWSKHRKTRVEDKLIDWKDPNFGLKKVIFVEEEDEGVELTFHSFLGAGEWELLLDFVQLLTEEEDPDVLFNAFVDRGPHGEMPLHTLAWKAPPVLTAYMLDIPPRSLVRELLLQVDSFGNTPLHLACANVDENLDLTVVKELLMIAPEALEFQNTNGDYPLHLLITSPAFKRGQDFQVEAACEEALSALLDGSRYLALAQNRKGLTLLHCAIAHGAHERVLDRLLKVAPQACKVSSESGMLPIHFVAAFSGTPWTIASQILFHDPKGLNAQTVHGDTPLHLLLSNAHKHINEDQLLSRNTIKLGELLVGKEDSADSPLFTANEESMYPLHCCARFESPAQLTRLLMSRPHAMYAAALTSSFGSTALHLLCASPNISSPRSMENIDALASEEACLIQDDNHRTPLMVAVQNGQSSAAVVKTLCQVGKEAAVIPMLRDFYPLHLAVQSEKVKEPVVSALIKAAGTKALGLVTTSGNTVLHEACLNEAPASVITLLVEKYPAAISEKNSEGKRPVALAKKNGYSSSITDMLRGQSRLERIQRRSLLSDIIPDGDKSGHSSGLHSKSTHTRSLFSRNKRPTKAARSSKSAHARISAV